MTMNHQSSPCELFKSLLAGNCPEYLMTYVAPVLVTGYLPIYDSREDAYFESFEGIFLCLDENRMLVLDYDGDIYSLPANISGALLVARTIINSRCGGEHE